MKALEDLKEMLEDELKKITKKGDITPQELESAYKAVDILKDMETIKAMKDYGEDEEMMEGKYSQRGGYSQNQSYGYGNMSNYMPYSYGPVWNQPESMNAYTDQASQRGSYNGYSMYSRGRDGDGDGQYSEAGEGSYRRGRDARTGRYVSRDGGSYDEGGSYARDRGMSRRYYSRHAEKERMIEKLEDMMRTASNEKERMAIQQCIEELDS